MSELRSPGETYRTPERPLVPAAEPARTGSRRKRRRTNTEGPITICAVCREGEMIRAHRVVVSDFLISCFGIYPFFCENCARRTRLIRGYRFAAVLCLMAIGCSATFYGVPYMVQKQRQLRRQAAAAALRTTPSPAPADSATRASALAGLAPGQRSLTNKDILDLVKSGMSSRLLIQLIQRMEPRFGVDPQSLAELKQAGTPEDVILSMVDSKMRAQARVTRDPPPANGKPDDPVQ